jgi:hypothetical protein
MRKTVYALMCMASLAIMTACGGGNTNQNTETQETEATEPTAEATETAAPETADNSPMTFEDFSAQLKEACGLEAIANDKMTKIITRKDKENEYFMASPVDDDIDGEAVQREYFNACAKVADGNNVYGYYMNGERGSEGFKDYDSYVKFIKANGEFNKAQYGYDYQGKKVKVYCSVSFGDFGLDVTVE